jgi:hypothetical protein
LTRRAIAGVVGAVITPLRVAGALVAALVATPAAVTTLAYVAAARARRAAFTCPDDEEDVPWPARVLASARAFACECGAALVVAFVAPLAFVAPRRRAAASALSSRVVVLVPGFGVSRASLHRLAGRLARDGWDDVVPVRHGAGGSLDVRAARVGRAVDTLRAARGVPTVDVVAYGLGGLVVRAWLRARGRDAGVAHLVTLGTAHRGTDALRWLLPAFARPGSPALARLASDDPVPGLVDCTCIHSTGDACVVPAENGYYSGAFNVEMRDAGHLTLLFSRRAYELVRESLAAEPVAPSRTGGDRW